jgi:hypothetical protein
LPGRDLLDFSALEKIEFSPEIPDGEHHSGYEDLLRREEIEKRTAKILNAMAHKTLAILKSLILNGRGIMDWPIEPPTLEFPVLGQFIHAFDSNIASERKMLNTDPEGLTDSQYCLDKHFYNELPFKHNHGFGPCSPVSLWVHKHRFTV